MAIVQRLLVPPPTGSGTQGECFPTCDAMLARYRPTCAYSQVPSDFLEFIGARGPI